MVAYVCVDGQKIAKRVSSQIRKETNKLQKLVMEYNLHVSPDKEISFEMAADPQTTLDSKSLPSSQKNEVIEAYLRKERSREEMELLEIEMKQTLDSLKHKQNTLKGTCNTLKQSNDQFSQGAHCILTKTMLKYEQIIEKTKKEFNAVKKEDESNSDDNYTDSDSDDSSDSDFEI